MSRLSPENGALYAHLVGANLKVLRTIGVFTIPADMLDRLLNAAREAGPVRQSEPGARQFKVGDRVNFKTCDPGDAPGFVVGIIDGLLKVSWTDSGGTGRCSPAELRHEPEDEPEAARTLPPFRDWFETEFGRKWSEGYGLSPIADYLDELRARIQS